MNGFSEDQAYRFLKVEEFFQNYKSWSSLIKAASYSFSEDNYSLTVSLFEEDEDACCMTLYFPFKNTMWVRYHPTQKVYSSANSRAIVQDNYDDLFKFLKEKENFTVETKENKNNIDLLTRDNNNQPVMKVSVVLDPLSISVYKFEDKKTCHPIWESAQIPIYYTPNGDNDYAIIQAVKKPATARYIGFGEQGGQSLAKNSTQSNYFNFDNMRYRQVYDKGPLDHREPLYHSDPFFMEFNGKPDKNSVLGIFIANLGQVFIDTGYLNSNRYMFGTRFGELNYFLFVGKTPMEVMASFVNLVGRSRLKPRYCLGYHQGCYGYDSRASLEWVVDKYREHSIPLDGLHIDVDLQDNYKTFTINTERFPKPKEMFSLLKAKGIKCSTNITPVISNRDADAYQTYQEGLSKGYFVKDKRYDPDSPLSRKYQLYGGGNEYQPNEGDYVEGFDSGLPYIGEVYYGNDANNKELGTTGHYPDLGNKAIRHWWGNQYQYLFDSGLEMVWQDMTTPAIRDNRGDMKGFPFRLYITDDSISNDEPKKTPAIKIWNLYSYNLHKATYHGLNNLPIRENKRNFIIGRGCFTGSHRFAGLWTGDNSSDWDFLQMNVSQVLSLGMCGLDICGQDIGGFENGADNGKWASPELLIRWTLTGAFLPWFRNHYVRKGRKEFQEPFMYQEWFNQYRGGVLPEPADLYRMVLPICKHYIQLRYRLMQLFYDSMFSNTLTGIPICRPLFINDPEDKALYNDKIEFLDNEFFVGTDFLVAPVLTPQTENNNYGRRDIYLPSKSNWYSFMDNTMPLNSAVEGGVTLREFDANINLSDNHIIFLVPTFIREGAIIPTLENEQYVGQLNDEGRPNHITLNVYPGESGQYTMYLDDGVSRSSALRTNNPPNDGGDVLANSEYREVLITHTKKSKKREISIKRIHDGYTPKYEKYYFVAILHDPSETKSSTGCLNGVTIDGRKLSMINTGSLEKRSNDLYTMDSEGWYYNEDINISFIKVNDTEQSTTVTAEYY
jgi:alpha-glucosidase